jgi:hypothetical protein
MKVDKTVNLRQNYLCALKKELIAFEAVDWSMRQNLRRWMAKAVNQHYQGNVFAVGSGEASILPGAVEELKEAARYFRRASFHVAKAVALMIL